MPPGQRCDEIVRMIDEVLGDGVAAAPLMAAAEGSAAPLMAAAEGSAAPLMAAAEGSAAPHLLGGGLVCPQCGNEALEAVSDGTQTNFLCRRCWSCWHAELGYMHLVPVVTCPGCSHRGECLRHRTE